MNMCNESWFPVSCAIPPEMYKYSEAVVRVGIREREQRKVEDQVKETVKWYLWYYIILYL